MARVFHRRLIALGLAAMVLSARFQGAEGFRIFSQPLLIPERGEVTSYVVMTESNKFSFLPPPVWNMGKNSGERTVTFVPDDLSAKISFKINPGIPRTLQDLQTEFFRQEITTRYPEAKIVAESLCYTSGQQGITFDLESHVANRPPMSMRLAFIPFENGMVEFNLTAETRTFSAHHLTLGNLLTSFRIEPIPRAK